MRQRTAKGKMRDTRNNPASEIQKLTELYKQMLLLLLLLLGNCGLLLKMKKALCHRKGKGDGER